MPVIMTAGKVAEWALRNVGRFTTKDASPDPGDLAVALEALDMSIAELAGVEGIWWLKPISQSVPLTEEQAGPYDLNALLNPRLESFERAFLTTTLNPEGTEIAMFTRAQYEALPARTNTGTVVGVYIERGISPKMYVYPTPALGVTDQIRLYGQTYTRDLTDSGGNIPHDFPAAWQLWMINQTAYVISGGAVARLPLSERKVMQDDAADKLALLKTLSNRQNLARPLPQQPDSLNARTGSTWQR